MPHAEVASLYTTLTSVDAPFVAACERDATALEGVATASEAATEKVAAGEAKQTAAVESAATKTEASQGRMARGWAGLTKQIEEHGSKTSQVWAKVTKAGEMSSLALLGIGAASVKMAADFQSSMELLHTQAGAAQSEVDALGKQVLALAPIVGAGPDKLAEGLYHIESAGFRGQQAMEILAASAKDAAIGMGEMETTSQALIGTMAVGLKDVHNAADAAAYLNTTVGIGDMRMEKLAAAISTGVLPSFKSAGLGMTDFSAALATLTDNVTPADEAATRLRMTVALMSAPSHKAAEALNSIGLSSTQLAEDMHKPNGLLVAVMDLKKHLEQTYPAAKGVKLSTDEINNQLGAYQTSLSNAGVATSQQTTLLAAFRSEMLQTGSAAVRQNEILEHAFGGGRTSGAILTLIEESDRLKTKYEALGTSGSRAAQMQDAWRATQATFRQSLHTVGAQLQVLGVQIGTWLLPPLTKLFGFMATHTGAMKAFFVVLVAGMAAFTVAVIANTVAMLANPTVWIVIGIVAAIGLLVFAIYELVKHWKTVWGFIKRIALDVWHWLVTAWNAVFAAMRAVVMWAGEHVFRPVLDFFVSFLLPPIKVVLAILRVIWSFAWGFLSVVIKDFVVRWRIAWAVISIVAQEAWKVLKVVWDFIYRYGIHPLVVQVMGLVTVWRNVWTIILTVVHTVWDAVRPILDKMGKAMSSIADTISGFSSGASKAGSGLAHLLGFDEGGFVPGAPGAAMLAVVHGGEFVVSRDMQSGRAPMPLNVGGRGGATYVTVEVHNHNYIDGKKIYDNTLTNANRHRIRNVVTGV